MVARVTNGRLKAALKKHAGIMAFAANEVGLTRSAVCKRVKNSPELQEWMREIEETIDDMANSVIVEALTKKDKATARWWAERRDKRFAQKLEVTGKDGGPVQVAPVVEVNVRLVPAGEVVEPVQLPPAEAEDVL